MTKITDKKLLDVLSAVAFADFTDYVHIDPGENGPVLTVNTTEGLSYTGKSCSQAIFALVRYKGEYVFCFAQSPLENLWRGQRDWYWLNDEVYFYDRNQASIYSAATADTITASDFTITANSYGAQYCDFSLFYKSIAVTFVRDLVQHYIKNSSGDHIYTTQPEFERYFYRETLVARNYNVRVYPFSANNLIDHVFDSTWGWRCS